MEAFFRELVTGRSRGWFASLLRGALSACSVPYRGGVATRNWLYDASFLRVHRLNIPVVSVGNLTLGGTGKTPFVEFACRWFLEHGKRVGILSRGYGSSGGPNDEALALQANLPQVPHWQGKDRVGLARQAVAEYAPEVLVLDDGFQHRRLARDLDIVLIDCTDPFGGGRLFPRGLLREPVANLARCDVVVLSRANQCSDQAREEIEAAIRRVAESKLVVQVEHRPISLRSVHEETLPLATLEGRSVLAFCGIGNPAAFWSTLRQLGCELRDTLTFPDHHAYSAADLNAIESRIRSTGPELVVTTLKDQVKIPRQELAGRPLLALNIQAVVHDPAARLCARFEGLLVRGQVTGDR